jgi:predicted nucleotidyltransferase
VTLIDQPPRLQGALRELAQRLGASFGDGLVLLRLCGSRAKGQANAGSDVDVAVVLEHAGWKERCAVIDAAADVGLDYDLDGSRPFLCVRRSVRYRPSEAFELFEIALQDVEDDFVIDIHVHVNQNVAQPRPGLQLGREHLIQDSDLVQHTDCVAVG